MQAGQVDPNMPRTDGTGPLNLAAYADARTAMLLLDAGAVPDPPGRRGSPFPVPLVMSAARGDATLCARLLAAGSHPDELHPSEGFAPLHAAVSSEASRSDVIRLLLAAGADVNLLRSANPIWSPLMYAATRGSLEHLRLLLGALGVVADWLDVGEQEHECTTHAHTHTPAHTAPVYIHMRTHTPHTKQTHTHTHLDLHVPYDLLMLCRCWRGRAPVRPQHGQCSSDGCSRRSSGSCRDTCRGRLCLATWTPYSERTGRSS